MARESIAHLAERGLPLRRCVLLSQALKHELPADFLMPVRKTALGECAADGKQRALAMPERAAPTPVPLPVQAGQPAPVDSAVQQAYEFLAGRGLLAVALPLEKCYALSAGALKSAAAELPLECLSHLTEMLLRRLQDSPDGDALQAKLLWAVIDRVGSSGLRLAQGAEFVAGLLRVDADSEARVLASSSAMASRAFSGCLASFLKGAKAGELFALGRVQSALAVLAAGAGGPRIAPLHLQSVFAVLPAMLPYVGPDASRPIVPEDLAFILARLCEVVGGAAMPAPLREVVAAHVCSPRHAYAPALRGAMVYQVGVAQRLWEGPPARQQEWLAAIASTAGLPPSQVGSMAWALGLHVAGDPAEAAWHRPYEHIVEDSTAPAPRVVEALVALADRAPAVAAPARQQLIEGLREVVPRECLDDDGARLLGWATAAGGSAPPNPLS